MKDFNECLELALSLTPAAHEKEILPLRDCLNRIAAEDVLSEINIPSYPTSIKDGYAVRSVDGIGTRRVELLVRAGDTAPYRLSENSAAYVTTGSPLPEGADAVVELEKVLVLNEISVAIPHKVEPGTDVRMVGSDLKQNDVVIRAGTSIGAGELGLLATVGKSHVFVHTRPLVALLASGDELMEPGSVPSASLQRGQIYDCNRPMLLAAATEVGARVHDLGIVGDDLNALESRIDTAIALNAQCLITTGGVSVGDRDILRQYLERHGTIHFNKVNIKPGKPMTFATLRRNHRSLTIFSLPGNPASALVMFNAFVAPCLRKMGGWNEIGSRCVFSRVLKEMHLDERPEFVRAKVHPDPLNGTLLSKPTGMQRSSRIASAVGADVLLKLPSARAIQGGILPEGTLVETIVFADWRRSDSFVSRTHGLVPPKCSPPTAPVSSVAFKISSPRKVDPGVSLTLIRVVDDLATYNFETTMQQSREIEKTLGIAHVTNKTISRSETRRILRSYCERLEKYPSVVVLTYDLSASMKRRSSEEVVLASRVLVPGLPQFLREQFADRYAFVTCEAGINDKGVLLLDLPVAVSEVGDCLGVLWPLLSMAANEAHRACVNELANAKAGPS